MSRSEGMALGAVCRPNGGCRNWVGVRGKTANGLRHVNPPNKELGEDNILSFANIGQFHRISPRSVTYVPLHALHAPGIPQGSVAPVCVRPHNRSVVKRRPSVSQRRACANKRRYPSQGHALEAAMIVGVERGRVAYLCPDCGHWHLASKRSARD